MAPVGGAGRASDDDMIDGLQADVTRLEGEVERLKGEWRKADDGWIVEKEEHGRTQDQLEMRQAELEQLQDGITVFTAGDALKRLEESLSATGVLSNKYRSSILSWAYKAVELAHKAGREEGQAQGVRDAADWLEGGAPTAAKWLRHDYPGRTVKT